jgi:aspartate/methionine/tyrosine aminotransferase
MELAWSLGDDVIRLEVGEPDFPTPAHIVTAAARAAADGHTKYSPNAGLHELRAAFADRLRVRPGLDLAPHQVVITNGATQGIFAALLAILEPGDEVLVPDPGWPNYAMMATIMHARPVPYPLTYCTAFLPQVEQIAQLLSPRTKALVLNSPSNPLGTVIDRSRLDQLLGLAADNDLWVLSDECYDDLVFDQPAASPATLDRTGRTIAVYTLSKSYAMTGWRIGCVTGPDLLGTVLTKLQEPLVSSVNSVAQWAGVAALRGPQGHVEFMRQTYAARRKCALDLCERVGLPVLHPAGTFYLWIDVRATSMSSWEFTWELAHQARVTVAPGSAFGANGEGFLRVSLTSPTPRLLDGLGRLIDLWRRRQ